MFAADLPDAVFNQHDLHILKAFAEVRYCNNDRARSALFVMVQASEFVGRASTRMTLDYEKGR